MSEKRKLSSPWVRFYKEIEALFGKDPDIRIETDETVNCLEEETYVIRMYVAAPEKAEALTQLLPAEKKFGSVEVKLQVIPANAQYTMKLQLFQDALRGNPVFAYTAASGDAGCDVFDIGYVAFKPEVVQYFVDDLGSLGGLCTTLYQEIAKDVFEDVPGIYFCTEPIAKN